MAPLQESIDRALASEGRPISAVVDTVIGQAISSRASDIHLEPTAGMMEVLYRIDGVLQPVGNLPLELAENVTSRVKVMASLVTYRTDIPQDGRIRGNRDRGDLRVSVLPTIHGEKAVIRIFDRSAVSFELDGLGFPEDIASGLRSFLGQPTGVLLLTGPSGSGKTTTIYALLQELTASSRRRRNIVTIEDPVEYDIPGVTQTQVNHSADLTFAKGLRSQLRQDPEVIVIGEIRDQETAKIAIEAGLTGHLMISTIHSGTACGVFSRLLEMGIEPYLLTSSLSAVLAQRLMRKLCAHCKRPAVMDARFEGITAAPESAIKDAAGCDECLGTGFSGRTPIGEFLVIDDDLRSLILGRSSRSEFEDCAARHGMVSLWTRGLERLASGVTAIEELTRVVQPPAESSNGG